LQKQALQPGSSHVVGSLTLAAAAETVLNGDLIVGPPYPLLNVIPNGLQTLTMESETGFCRLENPPSLIQDSSAERTEQAVACREAAAYYRYDTASTIAAVIGLVRVPEYRGGPFR
jgi:hypothetical protein